MSISRSNILLAMLILLPFCSAIAGALDALSGPYTQSVYYDWNGETWLIVQAYADVAGEPSKNAPTPDSTVITHQASTFGWSYDDTRWSRRQPYTPNSRNHKITVSAVNTPSSVRIIDPLGFDNPQTESDLPDDLQYVLDVLWDFAMFYVSLPFPSPWGLILDEQEVRVQVIIDNDLKGGTFRYNAEPSLQGADWIWSIDLPVNRGWYLIDVHTLAEAGFNYYPSIHVDDIDIWLFADFEVYR